MPSLQASVCSGVSYLNRNLNYLLGSGLLGGHMNPATRLLRRYWLGLYWLAFAIFTLYAATFPGFVGNPEAVPYPWIGVLFTWVFIAALTFAFHRVLKPPAFLYSWKRLASGIAIASGLVAISLATMITDQPGYYYVPMLFSVITFLTLVICAIALAGVALWRYMRHVP